jgi:hypothetical protein
MVRYRRKQRYGTTEMKGSAFNALYHALRQQSNAMGGQSPQREDN